ncbi:MAG: hypothetical protein EXR39_00785 [Betaproteobacteria bacterium]|nr:hypothetical protein [Betaproteobacteria bacterium]
MNTAELVTAIADDLTTRPGFVIEGVGPLPILRTGKAPLDTVLRNLVTNAFQHHDGDVGRVVVSAVSLGHLLPSGLPMTVRALRLRIASAPSRCSRRSGRSQSKGDLG